MRKQVLSRVLSFVSCFAFSSTPLMTYCGRIERLFVPKDKKCWNTEWNEYKPIAFEEDFTGKEWADPKIGEFQFNWNQIDGRIDRRSHLKPYLVEKGFPLNPLGRSGVSLRGLLGRWGPNHAADPIVTRWKRDSNKKVIKHWKSGLPVLQFVAIKRRDTKEWAIPGGMIDAGETMSETMKREFFEETLNSLEMNEKKRQEMNASLETFFSHGFEIFRGIVSSDPRNTDNAWMETVAINYHDDSGEIMEEIALSAGDDAIGVKWVDICESLSLYANHLDFIEKTSKRVCAHFH